MESQKLENLKDKQGSLSTIGTRLTTPTPPFFKKLVWILASIGTALTGLLMLPIDLPPLLAKIASYGVVATYLSALVAKLAVDWNKLEEQKTN